MAIKIGRHVEKIVAFIVRDAKNRPFVKMAYDFGDGLQDAYELSYEDGRRASTIFHKCSFGPDDDRGIVKLNPDTGAIYSEPDRNRLMTPSFITGTEPGEKEARELIKAVSCASTNLDIMVPFYVCSGNESLFWNELELETERKRDMSPEEIVQLEERLYDRTQALDRILSGSKREERTEDTER